MGNQTKKKWILPLNIILIVIILGVGGYLIYKNIEHATPDADQAPASSQPLYEKLNGSWANKRSAFTVTINTKLGTYNGIEFGEQFNENIRIDSSGDNVVFFKVNGKKIVCQFLSADDIILTKEGGIALELRRVKL